MRTMLFNAHLCWLLVFGGSAPLRRSEGRFAA